jgi:hypothetical protein
MQPTQLVGRMLVRPEAFSCFAGMRRSKGHRKCWERRNNAIAPYLAHQLAVGENCERGFVEPRLEIRPGAKRVDPIGQHVWSAQKDFYLGSGLPEDNSPTSCFSVYFVGVHELESTQEPSSFSTSRIFLELAAPFPALRSPLL